MTVAIIAETTTPEELDLVQACLEGLPAESQLREALLLIVETLRSGQDIFWFTVPDTDDADDDDSSIQ